MDEKVLEAAEKLLGHSFTDRKILEEGLTHASVADCRLSSNERMEFLGDAVLGMVVCDYVFGQYPDLLEGDLTKIKSSAVSRRACAQIACEMGLDKLLLLGKGMSNRRDLPSSLAAAVYESLIAALYLDAGYERARVFVLQHLEAHIENAARSGHQHNFKSVLQQHAQRHLGHGANYVLLDENGPDHAKCFEVRVEIGGRHFPSNWAASKKEAEQGAALNALFDLGLARRDQASDDVELVTNLIETD